MDWPSLAASGAILFLPTAIATALGLVASLGQPAAYVGLALAVAALAVYVLALRAHPALMIGGFLLWLSIERLVVAVLTPGLDAATLPLVLGYKELFFPVLGLSLLPEIPRAWREASFRIRVTDGLAIAMAVLIVIAFIVSPAPLMDRLIYARRLALLPLVYGVIRLLPWRLDSMRQFVGMVVGLAAAVAAFGLLERFVLGDVVWRDWVPAAYYYHLSNLAGLSAPGSDLPRFGLPVAFYDFTVGVPQRRLVSTYLEATTLSSFLAFGTILAAAVVRPLPIKLIAVATIGAAGYLTLGKAGWLIMGLGVGYVLLAWVTPRVRAPAWLGSMAAGLLGALLVISLILEASGSATGALAHFEGLRQGIAALVDEPFGHGLGIGGNFGSGTLAAESTFGVTMLQLGIPGLLLWTAWILSLAMACAVAGARVQAEPLLGIAAGAALIAFFGTAALTESAGGFLGNWLYASVAAAIVTVADSPLHRRTSESRSHSAPRPSGHAG